MSHLTAEKVSEIFKECLFKEGESHFPFIPAGGITTKVGFHPGRISGYSSEIQTLLKELPLEYQEHGGGGMSFLAACQDKNDNLWTGSHKTMQELFLLGLATGYVSELLPREMWPNLPGGVPYYMIRNTPVHVEPREV